MAVILTIPERRIAEAYVPVLDYVSRCALAVDRGDWFYLYDKAAELEHAAQRLSTAAHAGHKATAEPRGAAVRAFVADRSWRAGFRAGELLHPVEGLAERRAEVVREVAEKLGDGTREHRKDDMPARCDHARKITRAVIGSFEFDGGDPPPSREEDFRPIGRGYVIVYVGDCPDCGREVFQVVFQRYRTPELPHGETIRIPGTPAWTTGRPDGAPDVLPDLASPPAAAGEELLDLIEHTLDPDQANLQSTQAAGRVLGVLHLRHLYGDKWAADRLRKLIADSADREE